MIVNWMRSLASRKEVARLGTRIDELERMLKDKTTVLATTDEYEVVPSNSAHIVYFCGYGQRKEVSVSEAVVMLLNHLGLKLELEPASSETVVLTKAKKDKK